MSIKQENFQRYPLFVGITRPAMILGVTQSFFAINFIPCIILFFLTKKILILLAMFFLFHITGAALCKKDNRFFEILIGKFQLVCPNKKYWGYHSYDPN